LCLRGNKRFFSSLLAALIFLLIGANPGVGQDNAALGRKYIPRLEKILKDNIASFWLSKSLDHVNSGYTINFGPKGEPKGPGTKMIVSQARNVWLFSRMARAGYGKQNLDAAELGYRFLAEKMWDANGHFRKINTKGRREKGREKDSTS